MKIVFIILAIIFLIASILVGIFINHLNQKDKLQKQDRLFDTIVLSKDDQKIAFIYQKNGKPAIYTSRTDGSDVKKIIEVEKPPSFISFNPDGSKLLIGSYDYTTGLLPFTELLPFDKNSSTLEIIDLDSNNFKTIPIPKILITEAIYSPDGKTIYFLGGNYYSTSLASVRDMNIYSSNAEGANIRKITDYQDTTMRVLNISSNGKVIAAGIHNDEVNAVIYMSTDDLKTIKTEESFYGLTFSPDLKSSIFDYAGTVGSVLFLHNYDTKKNIKLTDLKLHASRPIFFNTQNKILFLQQTNWPDHDPELYQLMTVNTDGTNLQKIDLAI